MCIACEMSFWDMVDALPPQERERILREEAARFGAPMKQMPAAPFVCEPFDSVTPDSQKPEDERKP